MKQATDLEAIDEPGIASPVFDVAAVTFGARTGEAYQQLAPELHGFLVRVTRDVEAAADLLDDAFTRLLIEERKGRWPDSPRAWLYRVAFNLATTRGRRLRVAARVEQFLRGRDGGRTADGPEREVLRRELRDDLGTALATVGPEARAALLLAAQGFDGATIASMIGRSESATRTLMCRARMRLRDLLREDER